MSYTVTGGAHSNPSEPEMASFGKFMFSPETQLTGLIVFAHGSRVETANEGVRSIAADLARAAALPHVEPAFLELGQPDLAAAAASLAQRGVTRIVIIPYFLTLGLHLERDLPHLVAGLKAVHPAIDFQVTLPLEGHPGLLAVLLDRWKQAT